MIARRDSFHHHVTVHNSGGLESFHHEADLVTEVAARPHVAWHGHIVHVDVVLVADSTEFDKAGSHAFFIGSSHAHTLYPIARFVNTQFALDGTFDKVFTKEGTPSSCLIYVG